MEVLFTVIVKEMPRGFLVNLLPVLLWTFCSCQSKVFIEPLVAQIYAREYEVFRGEGFKEIKSRPMSAVDRQECEMLLVLLYLKNCTNSSNEAKHTFMQFLTALTRDMSDPPKVPMSNPDLTYGIIPEIRAEYLLMILSNWRDIS
jgi:hypothetical protein